MELVLIAKHILNHCPVITIRNLKTYNLLNNSNISLVDLNVNIINNKVLYNFKELTEDYKFSFADVRKYTQISNWITNLIQGTTYKYYRELKNIKVVWYFNNIPWLIEFRDSKEIEIDEIIIAPYITHFYGCSSGEAILLLKSIINKHYTFNNYAFDLSCDLISTVYEIEEYNWENDYYMTEYKGYK